MVAKKLMVSDTGGGDYENCPAGVWAGVCTRIVDLGLQETMYGMKRKCMIAFEVDTEDRVREDGSPFSVAGWYTLTLSPKGNLCQMLETWRGRPFTDREREGFDMATVLGVPALVTVQHEKSGDGQKTYANIKGITSLPRRMQAPEPSHKPFIFSVEDWDEDAFSQLSEKMQERVKKGAEALRQGSAGKSGATDTRELEDETISF